MSKVAFVLADDYEDSEFRMPFEAVSSAGHEITVIGIEKGKEVKGKKGKDKVRVEATAKDARPEDFDALVIPGGHSPDKLRMDRDIVAFTRAMVQAGKPVAAICHGPQLLIEADVVRDKTLTSWPSVKKDLQNAGAMWVDHEVVVSGNLITSRKPEDLKAFNRELLGHVGAASSR
jgi:protease I